MVVHCRPTVHCTSSVNCNVNCSGERQRARVVVVVVVSLFIRLLNYAAVARYTGVGKDFFFLQCTGTVWQKQR